MWKALVDAFSQVRPWAACRIDNGRKLRIGEDPWNGVDDSFTLSEELMTLLHDKGFFHLRDVGELQESTQPFQNGSQQHILGWKELLHLNGKVI